VQIDLVLMQISDFSVLYRFSAFSVQLPVFGLRTYFYFKSTAKFVNVISAEIILTSKLKEGVNTNPKKVRSI